MSANSQQLLELMRNPPEQPLLPVFERPLVGHATIRLEIIRDQVRALDEQIAALQAVRREVASWLTR